MEFLRSIQASMIDSSESFDYSLGGGFEHLVFAGET